MIEKSHQFLTYTDLQKLIIESPAPTLAEKVYNNSN